MRILGKGLGLEASLRVLRTLFAPLVDFDCGLTEVRQPELILVCPFLVPQPRILEKGFANEVAVGIKVLPVSSRPC